MDLVIFNFLHSFAGRSAVLDNVIIFFANYLPYILVISLIFFLKNATDYSFKKKILISIYFALSVIVSRGIIGETIKFFYARLRPFLTLGFEPLFFINSYAFPSGHASFFFALSFAVFHFNRKWGIWFLIFSFINGVSRVISGVHWPSDILGGIVVGAISFFLVHKLLKSYTIDKE